MMPMSLSPKSWLLIFLGLALCGYIKMNSTRQQSFAQKLAYYQKASLSVLPVSKNF